MQVGEVGEEPVEDSAVVGAAMPADPARGSVFVDEVTRHPRRDPIGIVGVQRVEVGLDPSLGSASAVAPLLADRVEHLLVVADLDDVAVRVLERADVADDRAFTYCGSQCRQPSSRAFAGDRVDVLAAGHLDADVRERGEQPAAGRPCPC